MRIVSHKSGQSKGLAYVEFVEEQSAAKALIATDQAILMGRKLTVAISNPPPKQERGQAAAGVSGMSTDFSLPGHAASSGLGKIHKKLFFC